MLLRRFAVLRQAEETIVEANLEAQDVEKEVAFSLGLSLRVSRKETKDKTSDEGRNFLLDSWLEYLVTF